MYWKIFEPREEYTKKVVKSFDGVFVFPSQGYEVKKAVSDKKDKEYFSIECLLYCKSFDIDKVLKSEQFAHVSHIQILDDNVLYAVIDAEKIKPETKTITPNLLIAKFITLTNFTPFYVHNGNIIIPSDDNDPEAKPKEEEPYKTFEKFVQSFDNKFNPLFIFLDDVEYEGKNDYQNKKFENSIKAIKNLVDMGFPDKDIIDWDKNEVNKKFNLDDLTKNVDPMLITGNSEARFCKLVRFGLKIFIRSKKVIIEKLNELGVIDKNSILNLFSAIKEPITDHYIFDSNISKRSELSQSMISTILTESSPLILSFTIVMRIAQPEGFENRLKEEFNKHKKIIAFDYIVEDVPTDTKEKKRYLFHFTPECLFHLDPEFKKYLKDGFICKEIKKAFRDKYLFSWDNVPGDDNGELKRCLKDDFDIDWAENAEITKSPEGRTINISKDNENSVEITMNEKKDCAQLELSDGRTRDLKVKEEYGELNIYGDNIFLSDETKIIKVYDKLWEIKNGTTTYHIIDIGTQLNIHKELPLTKLVENINESKKVIFRILKKACYNEKSKAEFENFIQSHVEGSDTEEIISDYLSHGKNLDFWVRYIELFIPPIVCREDICRCFKKIFDKEFKFEQKYAKLLRSKPKRILQKERGSECVFELAFPGYFDYHIDILNPKYKALTRFDESDLFTRIAIKYLLSGEFDRGKKLLNETYWLLEGDKKCLREKKYPEEYSIFKDFAREQEKQLLPFIKSKPPFLCQTTDYCEKYKINNKFFKHRLMDKNEDGLNLFEEINELKRKVYNGEYKSESELYNKVFKKMWKIHKKLIIYKNRDLEDLDKLVSAINMFFVDKVKINLISSGVNHRSFDV